MKNIYILFLALGLLVFSACTQNNQQGEKSQSEIFKTSTIEKDREISQLQNQTEKLKKETFMLSKDVENVVNAGDTIIISNLIKYVGEDQIIVSIGSDFYKIMEYEAMDIGKDGTYNITLTAPERPGNYQVVLVEYPNRVVTHTRFNLTVLGGIRTREEAIQVAEKAVSSKIGGGIINITKVSLSGNKWHINLTVDYSFGCCRKCAPDVICVAVCVSCGVKTLEAYYIITDEGVIEQENIKEIGCRGGGAWFRNITGNELCSIDWDNLN